MRPRNWPWSQRHVTVTAERAVYGSFPFSSRGYALIASSPGCADHWLRAFEQACTRIGEKPARLKLQRASFCLRIEDGPWMIVNVLNTGADNHGRPDALGFHAWFVSPRDYRKLGAAPFALECVNLEASTKPTPLEPRTLELEPFPSMRATNENSRPMHTPSPDAALIARAIAHGGKVAIESEQTIEPLALCVWRRLPARIRQRASLATLAFGVDNRFDLVALPRLPANLLESGYLELSQIPGFLTARTQLRARVLFLASVFLVAWAILLWATGFLTR